MSERRGKLDKRVHRAGLALLLATVAIPAAAQQDTLIDPGDALLRRQVRSLDQRSTTAPGAGTQLRSVQQSLQAQSRGAYQTPEQLRIDRSLNRIGRDLRQRPAGAPPGQQSSVRSAPLLPASYQNDEGSLPASYRNDGALPASYDAVNLPDSGRQSSAVTVSRLLDRAEAALRGERLVQARSDLSAARGFLDDVDPNAAASRNTFARLLARMEALEKRLDAADRG